MADLIIKGNAHAERVIAESKAAGKALNAEEQVSAAQEALQKQEAANVKPLVKAVADAQDEIAAEKGKEAKKEEVNA